MMDDLEGSDQCNAACNQRYHKSFDHRHHTPDVAYAGNVRNRIESGSSSTQLGEESLPQLGDLDAVGLGAVLYRFLAAGEGLGDGFQRHALGGELVQLLNLVLPPRLTVAFETFAHTRCVKQKGPVTK